MVVRIVAAHGHCSSTVTRAAPAPRLNGMTTLVAGRALRVDTRRPAICVLCRRRIDWSGADHHRAPGSLEDGIVLCRDCSYRVEHGEAA